MVDQRNVVMVAKQPDHLFGFAKSHQAVIDEHARQLVADRLMNQHGRHGRIDPARQSADHARRADLGADFGDLGLAEFGHRPRALTTADMAHEIGDQLAAIGGVDHFGVELGAVIFAFIIGDHGKWRAIGHRDNAKAGGKARDFVAVAHPHLVPVAQFPQPVKQHARLGHGQERASEFTRIARLDQSAELLAHHLLAITDAENRQSAVEQHLRRAG